MNGSDLRHAIEGTFADVWEMEKPDAPQPTLQDDTVLLETGLDSLAFAVFVGDLEDRLGYDPFVLSTEAYYPRTFGEFVAFYARFADHAQTDS